MARDPAASHVVLRGHEDGVTVVAISPDNRWLVTGCRLQVNRRLEHFEVRFLQLNRRPTLIFAAKS